MLKRLNIIELLLLATIPCLLCAVAFLLILPRPVTKLNLETGTGERILRDNEARESFFNVTYAAYNGTLGELIRSEAGNVPDFTKLNHLRKQVEALQPETSCERIFKENSHGFLIRSASVLMYHDQTDLSKFQPAIDSARLAIDHRAKYDEAIQDCKVIPNR